MGFVRQKHMALTMGAISLGLSAALGAPAVGRTHHGRDDRALKGKFNGHRARPDKKAARKAQKKARAITRKKG